MKERILIKRGVFSNALVEVDGWSTAANFKRRCSSSGALGYGFRLTFISLPSAIIVEGEFVSRRHSALVSYPVICSFTIDSEVVR